jgi:hypothetical protein
MSARAAVLLAVLALPARAQDQPAATREGFDELGQALEAAVRRVSPPSGLLPILRGASRGYRLPGFGVVFVLPPRRLPAARAEKARPSPGEAIPRARAAAPRAERSSPRVWVPAPEPDLAELEHRIQTVLRVEDVTGTRDMAVIIDLVEAFRRDVEELRAESENQLLRRLQVLEAASAMAGPEREISPPSPPPAPAPPAPPAPPVAPAPPAPPWLDWPTPAPGAAEAAPEALIESVRGALVSTLEERGSTLGALGSEEHVSVAVDFLSPGGPFFRTPRTLVVKAKKGDLLARQQRRLSAEDLRRRIETLIY